MQANQFIHCKRRAKRSKQKLAMEEQDKEAGGMEVTPRDSSWYKGDVRKYTVNLLREYCKCFPAASKGLFCRVLHYMDRILMSHYVQPGHIPALVASAMGIAIKFEYGTKVLYSDMIHILKAEKIMNVPLLNSGEASILYAMQWDLRHTIVDYLAAFLDGVDDTHALQDAFTTLYYVMQDSMTVEHHPRKIAAAIVHNISLSAAERLPFTREECMPLMMRMQIILTT